VSEKGLMSPPTQYRLSGRTTQKKTQHKIQQNKTNQETRWAYSTAPESPHGVKERG